MSTTAPTEVELAELLTRASRLLRRASSAQLSPLGITWQQSHVLRHIADGSVAPRMADIAAAMGIGARSTTSMVDALEQAGLVVRRHHPDDRRVVLVAVTGAGRRLLARMDRARQEAAAALFAPLGLDERAQLAQLLGDICTHAHAQCHSHGAPHGART